MKQIIDEKTFTNFSKKQSRQILIVTGMSGAGKSSVMCALEDLGFYCVDNFPVQLLAKFLDFLFQSQTNLLKVALSIDSRGRGSISKGFLEELKKLKNSESYDSNLKIVFLNSSNQTLFRRYQETRRVHPLARNISIENAVEKEREVMIPLEEVADEIHYTDQSTIHQLRAWVRKTFSDGYVQEVVVNLISFGFKHGVPAESNVVYDLRFLPNPYFVPELRKLTGKTEAIKIFLFEKREVVDYWDRLTDFLFYMLGRYYDEGRFFANIAIGCTGGRHRSVAFVEKISEQKRPNVKFIPYHRDLEK
jgi:UPF0042 nucleotide-binding protein